MSDITDQVEFRRKKIVEYDTLLGDIEVSYNDYGENQKDKIKRLAKILDESGHPKEHICAKVCKDVSKYGIKERYVQQILSDEYKREYNKQKRSSALSEREEEQEQKKPLLVGADGQTISTIEEDNRGDRDDADANPVDPIYGKSREQMRLEKQANEELDEDMEETSENPRNVPSLTQTSDEVKEILAASAEKDQVIAELVEQIDSYKKHLEKQKKIASPALVSENEELRKRLFKAETMLTDFTTSVKAEGNYKEIEVLKLDVLRDNQIITVARKAQKTVFLWVNPKTNEILEIKTDVEQHRIQALRDRGMA